MRAPLVSRVALSFVMSEMLPAVPEQDAGIEDAARVPGALEGTHGGHRRLATVADQPVDLRDTDAVLRTDAAAELQDQLQHRVIDRFVIRRRPEHVDVDVP